MPDPENIQIPAESGDTDITTIPKWSELVKQIENDDEQPFKAADIEETITVEMDDASPAKKEEAVSDWKDPDGWQEHYYPKDEVKLRDALVADPELFKRIIGDPIGDTQHPFHKPFADTQTNFHQARQRVVELEAIIKSIPQSQEQFDDDPLNGKYGGITAEMVDSGDATYADFERARAAYNRRSALETERQRILNDSKKAREAEEEAFRNSYPDMNLEEIYEEYSPVAKDGNMNPRFKPITLADIRVLKLVGRAGGFNAYVQQKIDSAVAVAVGQAKKDAIKEIANIKRTPHLTAEDQEGTATIPELKQPRTPQEIIDLKNNDPEGYKRWAAKLPWLQKSR